MDEKSHRCRFVILSCFARLDNHVVKQMDAADAEAARILSKKGRRRHYATTNASRLQGPLGREAYVVGLPHRTLLRTPKSVISPAMIADICAQHDEQQDVAHA